MTETAEETVWKGAEALRPFLVPIESLEPFPGNPKRGDVEAVRVSLRRWGQVRPILLDATLATRIVAGHHVRLGAQEEGWTHIAAIANEFADEEEARAYLLADNRIPELGGYDTAALVEQLKMLEELDGLDGTGYVRDDIDDHLAALRAMTSEPPASQIDPTGKREHRDPSIKELVLMYDDEHLAQVEIWLGIVAKEKGTSGTSETFYEALRIAARAAND